jgi:hypothetical protein
MIDFFGEWLAWVPVIALIAGQAILLFLSVDTSFKKLKPRAHVAVSVTITSMLFALLALAGISAVGATVVGDKFLDRYWESAAQMFGIWAALWMLWGIVFYLYFRNSTQVATGAVSRVGTAARGLLGAPGNELRHRDGNCRDAAGVWSERSAAL